MARRRNRDCGELLDFTEVERLLQLGTRTDIGTHEIPVRDVVGSVSRVHEFDGCFRPKTARLKKLIARIQEAKPDAPDDPILVYQVDHAYFVVDGHKRLSIAIAAGREFIDAEVGWYPSRFHLAGGTTMDQIRATDLERRFRHDTGLGAAVPEARFPLSDPAAYLELAESVKAHGYDLSRDQGRLVEPAEAARHWYDFVFRPVVDTGRAFGLGRVLTSCSEPELFLLLRQGASLLPMDHGWQMPAWFEGVAKDNIRRSEPAGVPAVIARVAGRAKPTPKLLPTSDVRPPGADPAGARTLVRRPRPQVDGPADREPG
jgi:hypothetical protein